MDQSKLIVSQTYVVVKVEGAVPREAVSDITDGGETFAVVPIDPSRMSKDSVPALEDSETGELVVPTQRVTLRGDVHSAPVKDAIDRAGANLIRDYGIGGMIEAPNPAAAAALAAALAKLGEVKSTEQQLLRPRAFKKR